MLEMPANFPDALFRLLSNMQIQDAVHAEDILNQFFDELGWALENDSLISDLAEHLVGASDIDRTSFDQYWQRLQSHARHRGVPHLVQAQDDFKSMHALNIDPDEIVDQLILRVYGEVTTH